MGEEKRQDCHVNKCIATTRSKNKASTYHKKRKGPNKTNAIFIRSA
jgi:hypothetical protein